MTTDRETCGPTQTPDDIDIDALREKYAARARQAAAAGRLDAVPGARRAISPSSTRSIRYTPVTPRDPIVEDIDVVVLGGGFAGLLAGAYLKKAGVEDVRVIEMAGDFGGVWYWNRFPGIQCDNDAYCYIPLLEELDFMPSKKFADGAEIFEHCRNIGKHFGLYDGALFSTQVRELRWDESIKRWRISTNRGDDIRARFVVMAAGLATTGRSCPASPGSRTSRATCSTPRAGTTTTPAAMRTAAWTSWPTSASRSSAPARPASSWCRTSAEMPSSSTSSSARRRRSTSATTRRPIRTGSNRCSRAGRRSASATSTPGHRSRAWCSASRTWSATSGPSSAAT